MPAKKWTADLIQHSKVAAFNRVDLHGPELDEHDQELIDRLASELFDEFCDYVAARNAVKIAIQEDGGASQYDLDRLAKTRDDLMAEIDTGLLLKPADAEIVSSLLFEATGRVGTEL